MNINKLKPKNTIIFNLKDYNIRDQLNICSGGGYLGDFLYLGFLLNPFGWIFLIFSNFNKKPK